MTDLRKMMFADLERLEEKMSKEQLIHEEAKKMAKQNGTSTNAVKQTIRQPSVQTLYYDMSAGDKFSNTQDDAMDEAMEIEKEEEEKKKHKVKKSIEKVKTSLQEGVPQTMAHKIAKGKYKPFPGGAAALAADMYETDGEMAPVEEMTPIKKRKQTRSKNVKRTMETI